MKNAPRSPLLCGKTALILGTLFLILLALFTMWAAIDRIHRTKLETVQGIA